MTRNWTLMGSIVLTIFLMAGCGRAEFVPLSFNEAPWQNGEASAYSMSNSSGAQIGTARIDITSDADAAGDAAWTFRQELLSAGDEQLSVVAMHAATLRPYAAIWTRNRAEGVEVVKTTYAGAQADLELTSLQAVLTHERVSIPSDVRDEHTIALLARALPLQSGYATRINTFLPIAGLNERTEIVVAGEEQIETQAGAFDAWQVNLTTESIASKAWIGKEPPFPLLKYDDARSGVVYELVDFQVGN